MLTNKYFIAAVVTLLAGAVGYNVWYFFLSEEEAPPAAERVAGAGAAGGGTGGPPPTGDGAGRDTASAGSAVALVTAAARGLPALLGERELTVALDGRAGPGEWGRDPLSRVSTGGDARPRPASPPPDWEVTAIVTGEGRRAAVIDGEVYRTGDRLDGGTVVEIRTREVVVRWRGRRVTVPLKSR